MLEHHENYQKTEGLTCPPELFIPGCEHRSDELGQPRRSNATEHLFGKGFWDIRDMYTVWEFKLKIAPADRGKAYSYALHLSRGDQFNTYFVILI